MSKQQKKTNPIISFAFATDSTGKPTSQVRIYRQTFLRIQKLLSVAADYKTRFGRKPCQGELVAQLHISEVIVSKLLYLCASRGVWLVDEKPFSKGPWVSLHQKSMRADITQRLLKAPLYIQVLENRLPNPMPEMMVYAKDTIMLGNGIHKF